jgi:hypothetical protein
MQTLRIGNDKVDLRVIPEAARVECYIPYNDELKLVGTVKDQLVIPPVVKGARLKRIQEEAEKTKSLKRYFLIKKRCFIRCSSCKTTREEIKTYKEITRNTRLEES